MNVTTATIGKRVWNLNELPQSELSKRDLLASGFDGTVWFGVSEPVGRQRAAFDGLFYRTQRGEFVCVLRK